MGIAAPVTTPKCIATFKASSISFRLTAFSGAASGGARGEGVHQAWMDDLSRQGIKRAVGWVEIDFKRNGKPKRARIYRIELFTRYEGCERVLDAERLDILRTTGVLEKVGSAALEKAAHGYWIDVPKPEPHPFVGAARMVFFDDEWLPALWAPLYCAGEDCLNSKCTGTDVEKKL